MDSAASLSDAIASAWRQQVETSEQRAAARLQEMGILNEAILSRLQQMYAGNQVTSAITINASPAAS